MSSTQFWVGALVPSFLKWVNPYLRKFFKLSEFDAQTQARVANKQYPSYFRVLYGIWVITLLGTGIVELLLMMIYGSSLFPGKSFAVLTFLGLINMIGVWFIFGAILDMVFWQISTRNFKDYVILKQFKSGWGYDIKQQIVTLFKIGFIYYIFALPFMALLISLT